MLGRNPSIRACFPEGFFDSNFGDSGQNSRRSYTASSATATPSESQPNSSRGNRLTSLNVPPHKPWAHAQTQTSVADLVHNNASKLPLPEHGSARLVSQQTNATNHHHNNKDASAATPVQVVDKFIPQPSLASPPASTLPSSAPIVGE